MHARLSPVRHLLRLGPRTLVPSLSSFKLSQNSETILQTSNVISLPRLFHSSSSLGLIQDETNKPIKEHHPFAFAFDIDGVLLLGSQPYPTAHKALSLLNDHKIHYIFLTNGGGKSESERISQLSSKLSLPLSPSQIVLSHTPFRTFAPSSPDTSAVIPSIGKIPGTVLVLGGSEDKARLVAESYGFDSVVTSKDFLCASPPLWPFHPVTPSVRSLARPLPPGTGPNGALQINAIFVFNDPRDWGLDIQLIIDLLLSHRGYVGTRSPLNGVNGRYQADGQPPLFFGCDDLLWANEYHLPRLGQGAFKKALEGVWREVTGSDLACFTIGKPFPETYKFAEGVLSHWRHVGSDGSGPGDVAIAGEREQLKRVYMVGDNPASDIRGANGYTSEYGTEWVGCLVKSGVYKGGEPSDKPGVVVEDVLKAVEWALEREGVM